MVTTDDLLTQLYKMAAASPHREICGIITADKVYPLVNVAQKDNHFVLQKSGYFRTLNLLKQEGKEVLAIYHSHINGDPTPSPADIAASRRTKHNYLIVAAQKYCWVEA